MAKSQVGSAVKGNGQCMTADDWRGNNLADVLAKKGAKIYWVKWHTRRIIDYAEDTALKAALQLGITTHAANNVQVTSYKPDGTEVVRVTRDSAGLPRHKIRKRGIAELTPAITQETATVIIDEPTSIITITSEN